MKEGNMTSKNKEIPLHMKVYTIVITLAVPDYGCAEHQHIIDPMAFIEIDEEAFVMGYEEQERSIS